jgi:hypothetical protein
MDYMTLVRKSFVRIAIRYNFQLEIPFIRKTY